MKGVMKLFLAFGVIALLTLIIALIIHLANNKKKTYEELKKKYKDELLRDCAEELQNLAKAQRDLTTTTEDAKKAFQHLQEVTKEIDEKEHFNQTLYKIREEELNNLIENKKKAELEKVGNEIKEWASSAQDAARLNSTQYQNHLRDQEIEKEKELNDLCATIEDYKARRDVINQEILRARAMEEQQDFYRVQLPESSKHDLEILQAIRRELTKVDIFEKLLYDNYIKKSVDEMVKRVLKGENPSGIYKITRLKTGEIYIGKSVGVKDRWVQHAKSAFHCGTISHSILHTTIEKDGIENFTWELLEEVSKDQLTNREKYWIEFYDSKNFGLNERQG